MEKLLKVYTIEDKNEEEFLRKSSKDLSLEEINSKKFKEFLSNFLFTAKNITTIEGYIAAGLAAVQVGKDYNMFCILKDSGKDFEVIINPKMEILSTVQTLEKEGCLSIPHIEKKVPRFKKIKVTYIDTEGKKRKKIYTDYEAREIQHEFDHTKGILFTDRVID